MVAVTVGLPGWEQVNAPADTPICVEASFVQSFVSKIPPQARLDIAPPLMPELQLRITYFLNNINNPSWNKEP